MAFCTKCGTKLPEGSLFCTSCGASLASAPASPAPAPAAPAPAPAAPAPAPAAPAPAPAAPAPAPVAPAPASAAPAPAPAAAAPAPEAPAPASAPKSAPQPQPAQQQAPQTETKTISVTIPKIDTSGKYDHTDEFDAKDVSSHKIIASALYLLNAAVLYTFIANNNVITVFKSFFGNLIGMLLGTTVVLSPNELLIGMIPVVLCSILAFTAAKSPYIVFHAKQNLKISAIFLVCFVVQFLPLLGFALHYLIAWCLLVICVISFIGVCANKSKEPVVLRFIKFIG